MVELLPQVQFWKLEDASIVYLPSSLWYIYSKDGLKREPAGQEEQLTPACAVTTAVAVSICWTRLANQA